ncbi:MAG: GTP-binding protein [Candidatus Hermodarchaeia archaeon]|jgi:small GTP-binding protein
MRHLKILVIGPQGVGKTTLIKSVTNHTVSTDVNGSTVCLDFGTLEYRDFKAHLFGSPGLQQFGLVRKALSGGTDGVILVVDSSNPHTLIQGERYLHEIFGPSPPPVVIAANKQDLPGAFPPKQIETLMNIRAPVFPTQAHRGLGLDQLLYQFISYLGDIGKGLNIATLLENA